VPSYLLGTYTRGTRVENSLSVDAEDRAVRFQSDGRYGYRSAKSWDAATYRLEVTEHSVRFVDGPLRGKQLSLSSVSPNCRIVKLDGDDLFRADEVSECPMSRRSALTASDCQVIGTWTRNTRQGSLSSELLEVAMSVQVQADRFFIRTESVTRCAGGDCRTDEQLPQVGTVTNLGDLGLDGFVHVPPAECLPMMLPKPAVEPQRLLNPVSFGPKDPPAAPSAPTLYGRCTADDQCSGGVCGAAGVCTSLCKYDVQCQSPGDGMVASCRAERCMATCATGNACPSGTACRDGLCL
jgi:hypothetical protein